MKKLYRIFSRKICEKNILSLLLLGLAFNSHGAHAELEIRAAWKGQGRLEVRKNELLEGVFSEQIALALMVTQEKVAICFATRKTYFGDVTLRRRIFDREGETLIDRRGEVVGSIVGGKIKVDVRYEAVQWFENLELEVRPGPEELKVTFQHAQRNETRSIFREFDWLTKRIIVPGNGEQMCSNYLREAISP